MTSNELISGSMGEYYSVEEIFLEFFAESFAFEIKYLINTPDNFFFLETVSRNNAIKGTFWGIIRVSCKLQ